MALFPTIRTVFNLLGAGALFLAVLLVSPLGGEDVWKVKPPERWTAEEALRVLQDSTLTHNEEVSMPWRLPQDSMQSTPYPRIPGRPNPRDPIPPGPGPRRETFFLDSARYLVRWESARPVQEAFARLRALGQEVGADFQSPPPSWPEDRFVVTVKALRPPKSGREPFERVSDRVLRAAARLKTQAGEVDALKVERSGIGASAAVHFFFPRAKGTKPLIATRGERVEFSVELRHVRLKTKFRLEPGWLR